MPLVVKTIDASALVDSDLDDLAAMGGAFGIGAISKAKEDWVLFASAKLDGKLNGFMFSTLERIGGTPCVLLGMLSVKRTAKRDQVLKGLMSEAYHRALMAFPDEDVVVGSRFVRVDALEAFKSLTGIIPRPDHRAVGEERAWGKRLARRFGCEAQYDDQSFLIKSNGQSGFLDFESLKPGKAPAEVAAFFKNLSSKKSGALVVHGWTMTESLLKLGKH
ncbi:MAG: hypothetical protein ACKPAJ_00210 [Actinomycetota bacterium]|jgi:hypothetical protein|nr:hypothetical protein [Actinomycetota bacterium]